MVTTNTGADLQERLVFARGGWCRSYNATPGDEPERGGSYNTDDVGSEFANFKVINGRVYGYVRTGGLLAKRVAGRSNAPLTDVAIAFFATPPRGTGQLLVGWYRHARVLSTLEDRPHQNYGPYLWSSAAKDAVLLPTRFRTIEIPKGKGGTGQAQVTYARDTDGRQQFTPWIKRVRFIQAYAGPSLVGQDIQGSTDDVVTDETEQLLRGQDIVDSAQLRAAIEKQAMRKARAALRANGWNAIEDVSLTRSYDFHCGKAKSGLKVEVKGTRTVGDTLLFSDAEVTLALNERVDLYIVREIRVRSDDDGIITAHGGNVEIVKNWGGKKFGRKVIGWQITLR